MTLSFGAELVARVQECAFDELDAPMARVTAPFVPVPPLEDTYRPGTENMLVAAREVLGA